MSAEDGAAARVIAQLKAGQNIINCQLSAESVVQELPGIVDHIFAQYSGKLRTGEYELELRIGQSGDSGFVPGVSQPYFYRVRRRLQRFRGWFLGLSSSAGTPKVGVPDAAHFKTIVFQAGTGGGGGEGKPRVRVPFVNGAPEFAQSEVMRKSSVCRITFTVDGQSIGFRLGVAEEKKLTGDNAKALIKRAELILTPTIETLEDKLRYGRDVLLHGPLTCNGRGKARLFVSESAYAVDGFDDPLVKWMKAHGGVLYPQLANQITWVIMNAQQAKRAEDGRPVAVLDHQPEKMIIACSTAGRIELPADVPSAGAGAGVGAAAAGPPPPPLVHIFPEGRYVFTAPVEFLVAGKQHGTNSNHDLRFIRQQKRRSFVHAKAPAFRPMWQIDCTETRQAPGVEGLRSAAPVYEMELEAGPGIADPGLKFCDQLKELLLNTDTFERVLVSKPSQAPLAGGSAATATAATTAARARAGAGAAGGARAKAGKPTTTGTASQAAGDSGAAKRKHGAL